MKRLLKIFCLQIGVVVLVHCHRPSSFYSEISDDQRYGVGYSDFSADSGAPFSGIVWYPASQKNQSGIPTSKIFYQYVGKKNAEIISGHKSFPLLVLSHGSGSSVSRLDWMAHYFAERGWVVVGINHPGNTIDDNSAEGLMEVWKRPQQISIFLDWFLDNHPIGSKIDRQRIAAAGHSAGGTTVLMLAGARLSKEQLENPVPNCESKPIAYDDERCTDIKKIDPKKYPQEVVERDYSDSRIKAVVAMDPGFSKSFKRTSPAEITKPIELILADKLKSPSGEIYSHEFPKILPKASTYVAPKSVHISFVTPCNEVGIENKIPICTGDDNRSDIQFRINQQAYRFLSANLGF